jgi:hypothetical protein
MPAPTVLKPVAQVFLYDTAFKFRGDLIFHRIHFPDEVIPGNFYDESSKTFQLRMHASQLGAVVGSLRADVPCFVIDYERPGAWLRTDAAMQGGFKYWKRVVAHLSSILEGATH